MNILLIGRQAGANERQKTLIAETAGAGRIVTSFPGLEVAETTRSFIPDLVVFNAEGHTYECIQIIEHLLKINWRTYILLIAGAQDHELLEQALDAGVEDFIAGAPSDSELILRLRKGIRAAVRKGCRPVEQKSRRSAAQQICRSVSPEAHRPGSAITIAARGSRPAGPGPLAAARKIAGNIFYGGLVVFMAMLVFFLVQSKVHGGVPLVFGHHMFVVLSGSMQPAFGPGSVVFVRPVDPDTIEKGDIITFGGTLGGNPTTHRVVDIEKGESLNFVTRGDANNADDPNPVPATSVVGRVAGSIPLIGYLLSLFGSRKYLIFLVFIPSSFVILSEVRKIFKSMRDMDKGRKKEVLRGAMPAK